MRQAIQYSFNLPPGIFFIVYCNRGRETLISIRSIHAFAYILDIIMRLGRANSENCIFDLHLLPTFLIFAYKS